MTKSKTKVSTFWRTIALAALASSFDNAWALHMISPGDFRDHSPGLSLTQTYTAQADQVALSNPTEQVAEPVDPNPCHNSLNKIFEDK